MKIVYLVDEVTGELLGMYQAQESPLEPGVYITPEASTDIEPPMVQAGFAICFNEGAWQYKLDNRGVWFKPDGEQVEIAALDDVIDTGCTREQPPPTVTKLKELKRKEINRAFENSMLQIVGSIPTDEVSSWGKQEAEARAYLANNTALTPLIDAMASARSVPKAELVSRIIAKADLFAHVSGTFIGRRQGLEDDLDALPEDTTPEAIAAISW